MANFLDWLRSIQAQNATPQPQADPAATSLFGTAADGSVPPASLFGTNPVNVTLPPMADPLAGHPDLMAPTSTLGPSGVRVPIDPQPVAAPPALSRPAAITGPITDAAPDPTLTPPPKHGLFGLKWNDQYTPQERWQILGASLKDAGQSFQGGESNSLGDLLKSVASRNDLLTARQKEQATETARAAAAKAYAAGDVKGAITALAPTGDLNSISALQDQVRQMTDDQRKVAAEHADILAAVGHGLLSTPYADRKAAFASMTPILEARGISASELAGFDPSDDNIQALQSSALSLKDVLAREDKANEPLVVPEGGQVFRKGQLAAGAPTPPATPGTANAPPSLPAAPGSPISVRQNNPGNLRPLSGGHSWDGQTDVQNGFAVFSSPEAGGRAAEQNLIAKQTQHGLTTLSQIIGDPKWGWAPASDGNDPTAYAARVAKDAGVNPNQPIDIVRNPDLRRRVLQSMFSVESGGTPTTASPATSAATPPPTPTGPQPIFTNPKQTGHASTPAEIAAAGLPQGTSAWTGTDGKPTPYAQEFQPTPSRDETISGEDFLKTLPTGYAAQIRAYANGDLALPTGNRAGGRDQQKLLNDIFQFDPSASAANLQSRAATRKNFTSGPYSQTVNATNTVLGHVGNLDAAIDELHNTGWDFVNGPAQFAGEHIFANPQTQKALADFNTYKTMVANELTKVYRGTGGAEADIQGWMKQMDSAKSPTALHATVQSMVNGLDSRLQALGATYSQGMGKTTDPLSLLTGHARSVFNRLHGGEDAADATPATGWKVLAVH